MRVLTVLWHSLRNLLSIYAYPILCFDISPMATALAAGFLLLGAVVQGFRLYRRKRASRGPVLCAVLMLVPLALMYLLDVLDHLVDQRKVFIPLIHENPLVHSNFGLYVLVFSMAAFYALLGALLGWAVCRALARRRKP